MDLRHLLGLITLGALWGASFLFTRIAAPEFGAVVLMAVRVGLAAMVLVPLLLQRGHLGQVKRHWRAIALMGVLHYALPFSLFAYALLTLSIGYASVINASAPLMTGLIGWLWMRERIAASRVAGLVIGVGGIALLAWEKLTVGSGSVALAASASLLAAFCYGLSAVLAKKTLAGIDPVAIAGGSMFAATIVLLPLSFLLWPATMPSLAAWSMAAVLGVACTAGAFVLYFALIAQIGPSRAITVTFLIPVFAVLFGAVFLDEQITATVIGGGFVVVLGTVLSTGLVDPGKLTRIATATTARTSAVVIAATVLGAASPQAHASEWQLSTPVYVAANAFAMKTDDGTDSFATLAASAELELSSIESTWSLSLFSEYHASRTARVDGTVFAGVQGSRWRGRWNLAGLWFASRYPGTASRQTFMARLRYQFRPGHKFGTEYLAYADAPGDGELKLGYYGRVARSVSLKLVVGAVPREGWQPRARLELSWRVH